MKKPILSQTERELVASATLDRAYSPSEMKKMKFKPMGLEGAWLNHLGDACKEGSWFVCGNSGNGKTTYALQMAKELTNHGRVLYVSIEQGVSATMQNQLQIAGIGDRQHNFRVIRESYIQLIKRLLQPKSASFIFIDSLQTLRYDQDGTRGVNYTNYRKLMELFPTKLFVFVSKAKGNEPWNDFARNVKFDSHIKIWVENYYATIETSRYPMGGDTFDIWPNR